MLLANQIRTELNILSRNKKKAWSEDGRGFYSGFIFDTERFADQFDVMKAKGFVLISESETKTVWDLDGSKVEFEKMQNWIWVGISESLFR